MTDPCCPCDIIVHPPPPDIAPGLALLPRQWAGFAEYRRAMLAGIPPYAALAAWRARGTGDLGVMLLEMWAYVLDVIGFYDARIANEGYLRTAALPLSAQQLVSLLGYRPKPAVSAAATLAVLADGADPVVLPAGTALRSDALGDPAPDLTAPGRGYPQLHAGDLVVVEAAGQLLAATVVSATLDMVPVPVTTSSGTTTLLISLGRTAAAPQPAAPATRVSLTLASAPPAG